MGKKTWPAQMPPTRDTTQDKRPTQIESEGWEKIFQAKNGQEKKLDSKTYITQNRIQNKSHKKGP